MTLFGENLLRLILIYDGKDFLILTKRKVSQKLQSKYFLFQLLVLLLRGTFQVKREFTLNVEIPYRMNVLKNC
jgi:hypothetical protein